MTFTAAGRQADLEHEQGHSDGEDTIAEGLRAAGAFWQCNRFHAVWRLA